MPKLYEVDGDVARPVSGFPNYRVYTDGSMYSLRGNGRFMKTTPDTNGYPYLSLYGDDKKRKGFKTARLVAKAFIPNPNNLPCVDHKDGDRTNNDVRNLRWVTISTNNRNKHITTAKSGYQGVYHQQRRTSPKKWAAEWREEVGVKYRKYFETKEEAVAHRAAMVAKYYDRPE